MSVVGVVCCGCCYGGGVCHNDEGTGSMFCVHCSVPLVGAVELVDGVVSADGEMMDGVPLLDLSPLTYTGLYDFAREAYNRAGNCLVASTEHQEAGRLDVAGDLLREAEAWAARASRLNRLITAREESDAAAWVEHGTPLGEPPL